LPKISCALLKNHKKSSRFFTAFCLYFSLYYDPYQSSERIEKPYCFRRWQVNVNLGGPCIRMLKCVHFTETRLSKVAFLKYICLSFSTYYDPYQSSECIGKHSAFSVEKFFLILKGRVRGNVEMRSFHRNLGFESCNYQNYLITRFFWGASSMLGFDFILAMTGKHDEWKFIVCSEFDMRTKIKFIQVIWWVTWADHTKLQRHCAPSSFVQGSQNWSQCKENITNLVKGYGGISCALK